MTTAALWIEITIAGSVYLAALVFLCLRLLGIDRLPVVSDDLLPYLAAGGVAVSYILGMLMHRLLQVLGDAVGRSEEPGLSLAERHQRYSVVWQFGSERVHKESDFQFALKVLFRSLLVSIPLLALTFSWWLWLTPWDRAIPLVIGLAVVLTSGLVVAYRWQIRIVNSVRDAAWKIADSAMRSGAQPSPGGGPASDRPGPAARVRDSTVQPAEALPIPERRSAANAAVQPAPALQDRDRVDDAPGEHP